MQSAQRIQNGALKKRMEAVFGIAAICFLVLAARLAWIQWVQQGHFRSLAQKIHVRNLPQPARRGAILASDGSELASNVEARDVCVNPRVVTDPAATARAVAELFGGDAAKYQRKIEAAKASYFAYLVRGVDREAALKHRQALKTRRELKGVELRPTSRRVYPSRMLAAALVGYVDIDGKGIEGLEAAYNSVLTGKDGYTIAEVDAKQEMIPGTERQVVAPVDGKPIQLTIDPSHQQFAEQELAKAVEQYKPEAAMAVVMDVRTGDILAMAHAPGFDPNPNARGAVPAEQRRCRIVTDIYEPGSTFKVITAAAALEEHIRTDAYCGGSKQVGPHVIHCAHHRAHGQCSLQRTIEQSCNIAAGTLAERLGPEAFYRHIEQFGFLEKTGVEVPGEIRAWMQKWQKWKPATLVTIGFGQSISVTPMQMVRAYAAIANDGLLVRPRLLAAVGGKPAAGTSDTRRVLTPENARTLREMMESVCAKGTGKSAKIAHYSVAGKTGTAEIAEGGAYVGGAYLASFIGFVPASQPRLAILVSVRKPVGAQYGGVVAGPVFREIARQAMSYMKIPPDAPGDERDGAVAGSFERWQRAHGVSGGDEPEKPDARRQTER